MFNDTITSDQITKVIVGTAPRSNSVSGYGNKIPTRYQLACIDGKTRRVYMIQYSNAGTPYVIWNGKKCNLSVGIQNMIENA